MRCLVSNKSNHLKYKVLGTKYNFGRSVAPSCEKVISAFERSLITPAVRKLMLDMPVPGRPGQKGSDHVNPCYKNLVKIEEVQSKIILHSALNVDKNDQRTMMT